MPQLRLVIAAVLLFWAVLVDFTSRLLSMGSDAVLIGLAVYVAWPCLKVALKSPAR